MCQSVAETGPGRKARQGGVARLLLLGLGLVALILPACRRRPSGDELFALHCASCHGADGTGDPRQLGLYPSLDLTRSELVRRRRNGLVFRRIADGWGAMPGFRHELELDELLELRDFTLNLDPRRNEP